MIKVTIKKEKGLIKSIHVKGHALYDDYGKDIVCAGVSSIVIGGFNALNELDAKLDIKVSNQESYVNISDLENRDLQIVLKTIEIQLRSIEEAYKENIKIMEV